MPGNLLELVVRVDQGQATAAQKEINAGFTSIEKSALAATASGSKGLDGLVQSVVRSKASITDFSRAGIIGMERLEEEVIQATARTVALRQELARHPERYNELNRAIAQSTSVQRTARTELRNLQFAQRDANENAQLLASSFGVRLPDAVTRFVTRLPAVQNAMGKAFSAGVAIAFAGAILDVSVKVGLAIGKMIQDFDAFADRFRARGGGFAGARGALEEFRGGLLHLFGEETDEDIRRRATRIQIDRRIQSEERIRQLRHSTELGGLEGEARLSRQFEFERQEIVRRGLQPAQRQAEILALTEKFSQEVIALRRKENEEILADRQKHEDAMRRQALERQSFEDALIEKGTDFLLKNLTERAEAFGEFMATREELAKKVSAVEDALIARGTDILKQNIEDRTRLNELGLEQHARDESRRQDEIRRAQDAQERNFQSLKRSAEGVLDALLDKSTSVWQAIANTFRATMLTAIKDVASSWIANILLPIFGARGGGTGGGFGARAGTASVLGGILPSVFGGGIPGIGPGGTPPFLPSSTTAGGGTSAASGLANFGGLLPGLKNFLGLGGLAPASGIGPTLPFGALSFGGKLSAIASSPAAALGGGLLALEGFRRGGLSGLGLSVGGGALTGFALGGPIGAAIGGGVGLIGGLVGLFRKSAEDKAREKIRAAYGVNIQDKPILRQIVEMAKSGFGGNLDVAIRSPQIRDLIQLYAMTTAQSTAGFPVGVQPLGLVHSSGGLFSLQGGQSSPIAAFGGPFPSISSPNAAPIETTVRVEVPLTLDGKIIESKTIEVLMRNGRAVAGAVASGFRASANRRESTALQLQPGLVVS